MLNRIITIDPGLNTGIAIWKGDDLPITDEIICPSKIKLWKDRLQYMWNRFDYRLHQHDVNMVYIEDTSYYEGNETSRQALKRGDLFHLNGLSHGYAALCSNYGSDFDIIPSFQWKGQMSKLATAERIFQINGQRYSSDHITDAVGLGFGIQKRLAWRIEK